MAEASNETKIAEDTQIDVLFESLKVDVVRGIQDEGKRRIEPRRGAHARKIS